MATLVFAALVAGSVALLNGPWLRIGSVASAGERYTPAAELDAMLAAYRGSSILLVDSGALEQRLRGLPAVADARVSARLPDRLEVSITEKGPTFTWLTSSALLVVAGDGTVMASFDPAAELSDDLVALPSIDDRRSGSRGLAVGDAIAPADLASAMRLLAIDPELMGSSAARFWLEVDDEYGFILASRKPEWRAALGFYQLDPNESAADAAARLEAQVAAIRTLFVEEPERNIGWLDARNPGKVYWAR